MVKRNEFLDILERNSQDDVINFVKQCRAESAVCLSETFGSCSKKQLDQIWDGVSGLFSQNLLVIPGLVDTDGGDDSPKEIIECVTNLLAAMLSLKELYIPESMIQTATLLQEAVTNVSSTEDKTKNHVAQVFEEWWKKDLPDKDVLILSSFVYIIERSLDLKPKPLVCDMKRVWSLHKVLELVELQNESSEDLKVLLQRCFISPCYMQYEEGRRFLAYVMTLEDDFLKTVHSTIKNHLLSVQRSWCELYGEVYFRAWHTGALRPKLELFCIQDLMYHAVHAQPVLATALKKLLSYLHAQKKQRDVEDMLYRLYEPIIWRGLKAANHQVRANSAALFFDVFPLQSPELQMDKADELLQKQFDLFQELLEDPFPAVRNLSVLGVFRTMKKYWDVIPQDTLKNLTLKLVQNSLNDASSADVRESVIKGLTILLDNKLCHLFLKPLLPEIQNSFHDVSEKVRIAMLELLKKVKSLRTIKYWSIVPIEHLLARLVVDSEPVNRRIMKLIFGSFLPVEASGEEQLERCITLITSNSLAARQFFRYAPEHMNLQDTVAYISMLCKAVLAAMQKSGYFTERDDSQEVTERDGEGDVEGDEEDLRATNIPLMKGLLEAICIMWTVSEDKLEKASNAQLAKSLHKKFSYALPEMMKAFMDRDIVNTLVEISAFLPPDYIPFLSRSWLSKLRGLGSGVSEEKYAFILEPLCKGGRSADVMELITEWLTPTLGASQANTSLNKSRKTKKRVGFVEPKQPQPRLALDMLSYLLKDSVTQNILLRDHIEDLLAMKSLLHQCLDRLEQYFSCTEGDLEPDLLTAAFTGYCKLCVLLHSKNQQECNCIVEFEELMSWADKHAVPVLGVKVDHESEQKVGRKRAAALTVISSLLNILNNMLLLSIGSCELCSKLVDFCTSCLTVDDELELLPLVMLCTYQVTEFLQYEKEADVEINNMIPNTLSRIFVIIAGYVKGHQTDCHKVLESVKVHVGELMKVVFGRLSPNASLLHDVMGTIMAAILAELAFHSLSENLSDDVSHTRLPPLSDWLLNIITKKKPVYKYFLEDMKDCCESGTLSDIHKVHGAVHILSYLARGHGEDMMLKELHKVLKCQSEAVITGLDEQQQQDLKTVVVALQEKIKNIEEMLKIEPA